MSGVIYIYILYLYADHMMDGLHWSELSEGTISSRSLEKHQATFFPPSHQLSHICEPVPAVASDFSFWLKGVELNMVFRCSTSGFYLLSIIRRFSAHSECKECISESLQLSYQLEHIDTISVGYSMYYHLLRFMNCTLWNRLIRLYKNQTVFEFMKVKEALSVFGLGSKFTLDLSWK